MKAGEKSALLSWKPKTISEKVRERKRDRDREKSFLRTKSRKREK